MSRDVFKVIVVGDTYVGKTAIINKYVASEVSNYITTTVGLDFREKKFVGTSKIKLYIWDTAGQERYKSINKMYYRGAHAVLLIFDITNLKSFQNIDYWYTSVIENGGEKSIFYLVGSKLDQNKNRQVTTVQAQNYANIHNMKYFEASIFEKCTVNNVFTCLVGDVICNSTQAPIKQKSLNITLTDTIDNKLRCC